jgi:hypothetical protein
VNIFVVDEDPVVSAIQLCDKHVVKMILETAQLLSTAHRILDGDEFVGPSVSGKTQMKRWKLSDHRESILLRTCHVKHPCSIWCRETSGNYRWLLAHGIGLTVEYTRRYGKLHVLNPVFEELGTLPNNLKEGPLTEFPQAMPDEYKSCISAVTAYRRYYLKNKSRFAKWKDGGVPAWYTEGLLSQATESRP